RLTWVSESFLLAEGVAPWSEMPLWVPEDYKQGLMSINCDKAVSAGLSFRPLDETIADVLTWSQSKRSYDELKAGMDSAKEQLLLRKWHEIQLTATAAD